MNADKTIELLHNQLNKIETLQKLKRFGPEFKKWERDTEIILQRYFGEDSRHHKDFSDINYSVGIFTSSTPDYVFQDAYVSGLTNARAIISSIIGEIEEYDLGNEPRQVSIDALTLLERVCTRFHAVARQLRSRYSNRTTIEIEDEYDVQDLLHGLLVIHFDDIRAEEWVPSYAGSASRVDFLLKDEKIVIEVKKTRQSLSVADIGSQLLVDIARYKKHPDCDMLVCFVYDPEGRIGNPVGLERDLEDQESAMKVRIIIGPKGH